MSANIHHNNYKLLCSEYLKELGQCKAEIRDLEELLLGKVMEFSDRLMTKEAEIATLKQKLKRKGLK